MKMLAKSETHKILKLQYPRGLVVEPIKFLTCEAEDHSSNFVKTCRLVVVFIYLFILRRKLLLNKKYFPSL